MIALLVAFGMALSQDTHNPRTADARETCTPLEGADTILSQPGKDIIVVGDYHGTTEIPRLVFDIICHGAEEKGPIQIGLELPVSLRPALNDYLGSSGDSASRAKLAAALEPLQDGRGSRAMMALLESIRQLRVSGADLHVTPFQPVQDTPGSTYEKDMADAVVVGASSSDAVLSIVYVGNVHAMRVPLPQQPDVAPMASFLPAGRTLTFNTVSYFGSAWGCRHNEQSAMVCQAWPLREGSPPPRAIWLGDDTGGFNGRYSVGSPFTASPPVALPASKPQ